MLYKVPELNEIYTKPAQRIVDPLKIHWLINLSEILKKINTIKYILLFINILEIIMSDHEEEVPQVEEVKVEACETINDALRSVIKKAQANNGKNSSVWCVWELWLSVAELFGADERTSFATVPVITRGLKANSTTNTNLNIRLLTTYWIGLVKGLNEVCKALDKNGQNGTMLVVMASNCDDAKYQKTVTVSIQRVCYFWLLIWFSL